MEIFKMNVDKKLPHQPRIANAKEKAICRMNWASCCYENEIMSLQKEFLKGVSDFKTKMDIFEEVMVLF